MLNDRKYNKLILKIIIINFKWILYRILFSKYISNNDFKYWFLILILNHNNKLKNK